MTKSFAEIAINDFLNEVTDELALEIINSIKSYHPASITWSRSGSREVFPCRFMLSGVLPGVELKKEPKSKKNAYEYHFNSEGELYLINSFGTQGIVRWYEYIDNQSGISIGTDHFDEILHMTKVIKDINGIITRAIHCDDDSKVLYDYQYHNDELNSIISFSSYHRYNPVEWFIERDGNDKPVNLFRLDESNNKKYLID